MTTACTAAVYHKAVLQNMNSQQQDKQTNERHSASHMLPWKPCPVLTLHFLHISLQPLSGAHTAVPSSFIHCSRSAEEFFFVCHRPVGGLVCHLPLWPPSLTVSPATDPGLWSGPQHRRRDDGLRGDPLVPGAWGHSQLDALHPDGQDNRSCYFILAPVPAVAALFLWAGCAASCTWVVMGFCLFVFAAWHYFSYISIHIILSWVHYVE